MTREQAIKELTDLLPEEVLSEYSEAIRMAIEALEHDQCGDCIRRSDIGLTDFEIVMCNGDYKEGLKMLLDKIEKAPSVTPQPKMGHWISNAEDDLKISEYTCSNCKGLSDEDSDFCPKCGCKMRRED